MSRTAGDITVIIPCLNAAATLPAAIESVLQQTVPPREILLIDDHSTDASVAVAKSYGDIVRVLTNPAHGTGPARNLGVREARGQYIAFVDADDLIAPTKHERQLAILEKTGPHAVVHTGASFFYDDASRPPYLRPSSAAATGRCTQVIFEANPVCGASSMLARSTILALGNYDPDLWGTDDFYMSLAASTCCEFHYLPEPLYQIRRHATQMSNRRLKMVYHHWLAQERFRLRFPEAFAALPAESVRDYMVEPVLRNIREAYWRRNRDGYRPLLQLARTLAPDDPTTRTLWRRRWCPLFLLMCCDRLLSRAATERTSPPKIDDLEGCTP
jgi:glycosyltransferase involved in cell wall biosynthesis